MSRSPADLAEIRRAISVLSMPDGVIEVRVPKSERSGTISGFFDDHDALAKAIAACNGEGPGVYVTLNPVAKPLLARASNRLRHHARETTTDHDIVRRVYLPFDFDPVRPAGISSTDVEHAAALKRMAEVAFNLNEEGWELPVRADSGNGGHLLYRIDLPNETESTELIKTLFVVLADRFDDEMVKLDRAIFNASRIIKAYGTWARKGDNTADRPHRLARLLDVPQKIVPVPRAMLEEVARSGPKCRPVFVQASQASRPDSSFDIEAFIARYLNARTPVAYEGGRKWVLETCPFDESHRAPDSAVFQRANGSLGFRCLHNSCSGKHWRDVRALYEGPREPQWLPPAQPSNGNPSPSGSLPAPVVKTAAEVYRADYSEPVPLVEAILFQGLTLFAGRPKIGKSWLALQLALALVLGTKFAGYLNVLRRCTVLYLSLEERPRQTR
jgi:hypothetical protein